MPGGSLNKFAWLEALRGADLTHAEYRVAVNLSTYARADLTNARPSLSTLCSAAHVSTPTAKKALRRLAGLGWIVLTAQGGNANGFGKANCYRLTIPKGVNGVPPSGRDKGVNDLPPKGVNGFQEGGKPFSEKGVSHLPPINGEINGEISKTPCRDDSEDEPDVDVEPSAPTPSDAGLFDLANPGPIDAELVDEPTRSPAPAPAPKPPRSETPEQRVTAAAYERVGKAFNFIAVRAIAKWAIHDRGEDPAAVEAALVGIHELGRPITKQTVGQWLDGSIGPRGRTAGPSRQDEKVRGFLESANRLAERLAATNSAQGDQAQIQVPPAQALALPSAHVADPARDPLAWIDGELPDGFGPGERDRAVELLEDGTDYHQVRWAILQTRNARPTRGRRRRPPVDGTTTTTTERTVK